jgi:hypothetical protein
MVGPGERAERSLPLPQARPEVESTTGASACLDGEDGHVRQVKQAILSVPAAPRRNALSLSTLSS